MRSARATTLAPYGLSNDEFAFFRTLSSPERIQDRLDSLPYNWCADGYECKSPRRVLREGNAHCLEGALFAAAAQRVNDNRPLVIEIQPEDPAQGDEYHFIAPFRWKRYWGAMAKSRTYVLTWRDPIYRSVRELAVSYVPLEIADGKLPLRRYCLPFDLGLHDRKYAWMITERSLEPLAEELDYVRHFRIVPAGLTLRPPFPELEERLIRHQDSGLDEQAQQLA
ncbi:hypothetical protein JXB02_04870 [Candidatus Woesearchaeota archaeon]|nr:hypothetical protein [Candidatus Woesearchaeota archaeon]